MAEQRSSAIVVIFTGFVAMTYGFGVYLFSALAPDMGRSFGFGPAGIGVISSAAQVGNMASALASAFLARRFGPIRMMYVYLALLLAVQVAVSQTETFWILAVSMMLVGGVASATWVAIAMATQVLISEYHRAKSLGLMSSGTSFALLLNGSAVPFILNIADWRSVWLAAGCVTLALSTACALVLRKSFGLSVKTTDSPAPVGLVAALRNRAGVFTISILFLGAFSFVPLQTFMTLLLSITGGWEVEDANKVWIAVGVGGIVGGSSIGWIADRTSVQMTLVVSFLIMACVTYALAISPEKVAVVVFSAFTVGLCYFAFFGLVAAYVTKVFDAATASVLLGVTFMAVGFGSSIGNFLIGWVIQITENFSWAYTFLAITTLFAAAICWKMPSDRATLDHSA